MKETESLLKENTRDRKKMRYQRNQNGDNQC